MTQTVDYIIQLSDNMTNSKADLLKYIEHFNGTMSQEYEEAEFLIRNDADLDMWNDLWNGNADEISESNNKLREWKIEQHKVSKEDFVELMLLDARDCLETVFQQPVGKRVMWEVEKALGEDLSIEMLWGRHMELPMARVEYLV